MELSILTGFGVPGFVGFKNNIIIQFMIAKELKSADISLMLRAYDFKEETNQTIANEKLLSTGLINRLHNCYPKHSGFLNNKIKFTGKTQYSGLKGFREILDILKGKGIAIKDVREREFFIEVYRFMATKHILNCINWENFENDPIYHLVFPQRGMINKADVQKYLDTTSDEEGKKIVKAYQLKTNPHDGKQLLNKPYFTNAEGQIEILTGCQHKYPPIKLVLDKGTQHCFAFCTYCFRHAQVRGDEDMFVQKDINQVHEYLKKHTEVSDVLITGGDGGYLSYERLKAYITPVIEDKELRHIRTLRIGSRVLTFHPEFLLGEKFKPILELLKTAVDNGIQVVWMSHFSTPRELLNPGTLAAAKRLRNYGLTLKSQSPIMNHISLYRDKNGDVDVDKSAQNWIDLGNILAMLAIGFHSMYCARPTGEQQYFTTPLADISKVFNKVFRSLASINRPSRYITMTSSAGKTSLIGTTVINGKKVFVLKFNEARSMEWMDTTYFAEYNEKENTIEKLKPYMADKYFYEDELEIIENQLEEALKKEKLKV